MMDYTDRHARYLWRLISRHTLLYTEMITSAALLHGDVSRLLAHHPDERPVALQLGGSDPRTMAEAARLGVEFAYDEINVNVGCPSDRVRSGRFGACLMAEPKTVADCVEAIRRAVDVPVTVKTRLGIDHHDSYDFLRQFIATVQAGGGEVFIVHARKAWLQGLSPKENREIPPLDYEQVYRLKKDFPELEISVNGGIRSLNEAMRHLQHVDGVMIGRAVFDNPWMLAEADRKIFGGDSESPERSDVVSIYTEYCRREMEQGVRMTELIRPLMGLAYGLPGARRFRHDLSQQARRPDASPVRIVRAWEALEANITGGGSYKVFETDESGAG